MKFYRPRWMDGMVGSRIYLHHDDILYSTVRYCTVQYRHSTWIAGEISGEGGLQDFCLVGSHGFARPPRYSMIQYRTILLVVQYIQHA